MMKEIYEFRIEKKYAHLLFTPAEYKDIGYSVALVNLARNDPRFEQIPEIDNTVREKHDTIFYSSWQIKRHYTNKELAKAELFQILHKTAFRPAGEECSTVYDESVACPICGANRKQVGPLRLQRSSIPKRDIARSLSGEVVVSQRFKECAEDYQLEGLAFEPVYTRNKPIDFFQIKPRAPKLVLTDQTMAGIDPFDFSESCEGEIYKCPNGHTLGLNQLSEAFVERIAEVSSADFFESEQKFGVSRNLLQHEPVMLCSPKFREMVLAEKLKGFAFDVAHVED